MKPLMLTLALSIIGCSITKADITIKGSDTLGAKMVPQLVEAYRKQHPESKFEIAAEGSSSCFEALLNGNCDIGMASRPASVRERDGLKASGLDLEEHVVAHDMMAVIVNEQNPIKNLSLKEVEKIFTGDVVTWDEFGGMGRIVAFTRNTASETRKTFQALAMNRRQYGKGSQKLAGGESLPSEVGKDANAIAYCCIAYSTAKGIRAVSVDGVKPILANVRDYPISRDLYFYTVGDMAEGVKQFIQWVTNSEEAHDVIERVGFIALRKESEGN